MPATSAISTAADAATTTAAASRPEVEVIQPGLALFPCTGYLFRGSVGLAKDLERGAGGG